MKNNILYRTCLTGHKNIFTIIGSVVDPDPYTSMRVRIHGETNADPDPCQTLLSLK
jgi:hypothetical protein